MSEVVGVNPYRGVGQVATGDRFVGRSELLRRIRASWYDTGRPGNVSVQGNHRMGKSSVVQQAIHLDQECRKDLVFVSLSLGRFESGPPVFRALVTQIFRAVMKRPPTLVERTAKRLEGIVSAVNDADDWHDFCESVREFFSALRDADVYVSAVLDEFDKTALAFTRTAEFQFLRDIASEPFASVGLITISRRPINVIEISAVGGSTLAGVLSVHYTVGLFSDIEVDAMLARGTHAGSDLRPLRDAVLDQCGGHPYLIELLCNELTETHLSRGEPDISAAIAMTESQFRAHFDRLVKVADEDTAGLGSEVLGLVSDGADLSDRREEVSRLSRLGLLDQRGDTLRLFSPAFESYFRSVGGSMLGSHRRETS